MVDGFGVEQAVILNIRPVPSLFPRTSYPRVSRLSPQCHEAIIPSRSISHARTQARRMFASEPGRRDVQIH